MTQKLHDELLLDIFSDLDKCSDFPSNNIRHKIAIFSTERSGSSLFCNVLHKTGMVGQAMEWLNIRHMTAYSKFFGIIGAFDLSDYLDFLMRKTTSKNGVFAVNIHISNYLNMLNHKFNAFDMKFDYCYYLYRRKKIDQAYSLAKARITDKWSADSKPARELPPEIRYTKVLEALLSIGKWEEVYRAHIQPHISREYFYEDFSRLSKTSAFDEVLSDLGITDTCLVTSTSLKRQRLSSDTSEIEKINNYLMPADV